MMWVTYRNATHLKRNGNQKEIRINQLFSSFCGFIFLRYFFYFVPSALSLGFTSQKFFLYVGREKQEASSWVERSLWADAAVDDIQPSPATTCGCWNIFCSTASIDWGRIQAAPTGFVHKAKAAAWGGRLGERGMVRRFLAQPEETDHNNRPSLTNWKAPELGQGFRFHPTFFYNLESSIACIESW